MNNAKILAPRRGTKTTMSAAPAKNIVLAEGEIFIENDTTAGVYKIKIGDGSTVYSSLPYRFSGTAEDIKFNPGSSSLVSTNVEDAIIEAANSGGTATGTGIYYGTCDSTGDTAAKVVSVDSSQEFTLKVGVMVMVKFTNSNSVQNVTINVNNTGAHSIYYSGSVYTGINIDICGRANTITMYTYDGSNWVWTGHGRDNDTKYDVVSDTADGLAPQITNTSAYLKGDGTWSIPNDTTYANVTTASAGLAPQITDTSAYLKGDGSWSVPNDTTYAAVSTAAAGLAPQITNTSAYLKGDGSWSIPNDTTYSTVTTSAAGLAPQITDTSAYLKGDGSWSIPNDTTYAAVSTAAAGLAPQITDTSAYLKGDGTWSIPNDTTYANVTTAAAGLAPQITNTSAYLKGDGSWSIPNDTTYANTSKTAAGLCPQLPNETTTTKYLRQDGSWQIPGTADYTWTGTQDEYDVLPSIDPNVTYFIRPASN